MNLVVCSVLIVIILLPLTGFADAIKQAKGIKINNVAANFIEYKEKLIYAKGNVTIAIDNYFLTADNLLYDIEDDILWAEGNVKIKDEKDTIIIGEKVILKDKFKAGVISEFILFFGDNTLLVSKLAERINENKARLYDSKFTPCEITCGKNPIWQISAKDTYVDFDTNKITYRNVFFEVYGVPIIYLPYFSHPTPSAPASSGILIPSIKNEGLGIPLYLRAKPNMDFTLTPRIFKKYQIFELEGRYRLNNTDSIIFEGNYGSLPYFLEKNGQKIKNEKVNGYHFVTNGNFTNKEYGYGFKLERTSDKAYLKNYYNNYSSYLTSKVFLNKIHDADYLVVEAIDLQGLGANDSKYTDPLVLPKINTKNVISLNDDDSYVVIENNTLFYKERIGKQLARTSLQLSFIHNLLTPSGQIFNFSLKDRGDFYFIRQNYLNRVKEQKTLTRNIPEFQTVWRYPFVGVIAQDITLLTEPIASFTMGRKLLRLDNKFIIVDPDKYELSEKNIFDSNRYSGIDCHEFGNRLNYGLNTTISKYENYLGLFLGQSKNTKYSINQSPHTTENVGKISAKFLEQFELFYSFRKDNKLKPIRDEIGSSVQNDKINIMGSFIQLTNLKKYYSIENKELSNNRVRQFYGDLGYRLTENWLVGFGARVDVSTQKAQLLSRTIKVTYFKDCVRIAAKISSDYMVDAARGIKKTSSVWSASIGLKILNM
ncbi:LPS-assembly protein LptD [Rickettsia endosymbiont of Halotydeus destructor]|uniref:LPS-assembly protein LptD n=1 Tax=Rickettsia endosymbiont of Halotydeus destructor TaxID=2996754 RepID=UPI003BB1EB21